ncbi:YaiI/YqxD family protein [Bacillus marasmi]|uniref:YaiI/YqxD family protein n=1 Tax=Bacillus marasmi TaxID=1926279 RepID=UPI0011CA3065|nr:YaiI/YqxD family protein [Bacillus marasmi]
MNKRTIFVDADSCPVKQELLYIANQFEIPVVFVASYAHMSIHPPEERWIYVDNEKEAADLYIQNHISKWDIVVTQDIGLASTLLLKEVSVLSPKGMVYKEEDMETALQMRFLSAKARRRGQYGKGPKPFSKDDRQRFIHQLTELLSDE